MEIWRNYFDIVILPPAAVRDQSIALSRKIAKHGGKFILGKRRYLPHISLYHLAVRPEDFSLFAHQVKLVAGAFHGGDLKLVKIEIPVLMTDKPAWLRKLHLELVRKTCAYVDRDYDQGLWKTDYLPAKLKAAAKANLEKYGSPLIGSVFRPHITLTSFEDKNVKDGVAVPDFEPASFHVDRIAICELGPSHSCQRVIAGFPLNSYS